MSPSHSVEPFHPGGPSVVSLREVANDAARYWEIRRIGYNGILAAVTLAWVGFTWPHFQPAVTWRNTPMLLGLAAIANACYCAAYPIDIAFRFSPLRNSWQHRRWILWCMGALLAAVVANYWIADEIYPAVN